MNDRVSWDVFYIGLAQYYATRSKDPSTKVGCVIVRPDKTVASLGYNGFPPGMPDEPEYLNNREEKYPRVIHAEMAAILNCQDVSLKGYSMYGTFFPCDRCFVHVASKGIKRILAPKPTPEQVTRWGKTFENTKRYASEMGIELVEIDLS